MGVTFRRPWPRIFLALALAATSSVRAQAPEPASEEEARERFLRADRALLEGRFVEARDLLRESLALAPSRAAAFNLGVAHRGIGETLECVAVLERLRAGEFGELRGEQLDEVEALLAAARAEVGALEIHVCGADVIEVRVDGTARGSVARCGVLEVAVNGGRHVVSAAASGAETADRVVEVGRASRVPVELRLVPLTATGSAAPSTGGAEPASVWEEPWLWVTVGAAVLAGAAAVIVVAADRAEPHVRDDVFGEIVTLRLP